jgi:hypothetical protein
MTESDEPDDRFGRAMRAIVDTPAGSLLVAGISRAHQRWPEAQLVQRSVESTGSALAEDGAFVRARLRFGSRLLVDSRDEDGKRLLFDGELDTTATHLMERIAWPGWTFFDVGAQTGYFALLARHLGGRQSRVHAFETDGIHGDHIADACSHSGDTEGILIVSARCGARKGVQASVRGPEVIVTIDEHCDTHGVGPDVLRIRADGGQFAALEGARRQLRQKRIKYLICPSGWRDDSVEIERFLMGYGYLPAQVDPTGELVALDGDPAATLCYRPAD